jgi:hypothetical protein
MGPFILAALLFSVHVEHTFFADELTGDFSYRNVDVESQLTKYGDTMFCFTLNECSNNFSHSVCLVETGVIIGCVSNSEESTPVIYMYPVNNTNEHCIIYFKTASWSFEVRTLINIWQNSKRIIQVRP